MSEAPREAYLTEVQFGGPLEGLGFSADWVGSACGPIVVAGMARALGLHAPLADVLRSAPSCGWTPEGGMNGPANLHKLLRKWGMEPVDVTEGEVPERLAQRPVILSTAHHYYLAQRASRIDDDLLVGNSGCARRGGGPWMSLGLIRALDGGINALISADPISAPAASAGAPAPAPVDPIDDALNNLFDLTLQSTAQSEERRRSAQLAIAVLKDALGKGGA